MADKIVKIYGDARFLPRHDTLENWQTKNPILLEAEPSYVIDDEDGKKIKFGDGVTPWNDLPYFPSSVEVDQTYSPTSENAQSGKAVAEAVAIEENRADNTFANALKGNKSDTAMLLDDVSPVTHEIGVKIRGNNLFDKDNANIIVGYPDAVNAISPASTTKSVYIPCAPNTTYTVSKVVTARFAVAFTDVLPASGVATTGRVQNNTATSITSASSANSRYIVVWIYHSNYDTSITVDEVLATLQIEQGTTATAYTPYVPDLTAVSVTRCGKNLFNSQLLLNATGWSVDENGVYSGNPGSIYNLYKDGFPISFKTGLTYTVSFYAKADLTADNEMALYICFKYTDGTISGLKINSTEYKLYKMTSTKDVAYMYANYNLSRTTYIKDFMLEIGTTKTDYEPYIGADYTPTTDGTVEGVTSLYPNTTLTTDTNGVLIDCEYNRDINKAFAALEAAIATNNS